MEVDSKAPRGPLWVDGQFTARLRGPSHSPGRILRIRRPFAMIGRLPGADIRIDDPAVEDRHALLLLDHRGIFGVDLLSASGTRFAGAASGSAWLGPGDILEIAGHRVELLQLRVDAAAIDPPLCSDDPLDGDRCGPMASITLESLDSPGSPWMLGSELGFLGRGDECAIRIENASALKVHCALFRGPNDAFVIDLLSRRTLINNRPVDGASPLLDGDVLTIGQAQFGVRVEAALASNPSPPLTDRPPAAIMAWLIDAQAPPPPPAEMLEVLQQFRSDTATLLEAQIERIESLNREITSLRDEIRGRHRTFAEPAPLLRLNLLSRSTAGSSPESSAWLLDRLTSLERESQSTWRSLLGRIASAVYPWTIPATPGKAGPPMVPSRSETT